MSTADDTPLADTAEFPVLPLNPAIPSTAAGGVRVDCAAVSHRGLVRPNNEDHYLVAQFGRYLKPLLTNVPGHEHTTFAEEGYGMVVADGLGGAAAGEVASDLAIRTLLNLVSLVCPKKFKLWWLVGFRFPTLQDGDVRKWPNR